MVARREQARKEKADVDDTAARVEVGKAGSNQPLHTKYRPQDLDTVVGQAGVVKSLRAVLQSKKGLPHAFLFTGPSGVGKTTLARILAKELKCAASNVLEIDAATNSGIENMRAVLQDIRFKGFGNSPLRFVVVDECHALSKATWQSLLLALEDPPAHVFWALCTTEPEKVPKTIVTRCHAYRLTAVAPEAIAEFLEAVRDIEELAVDNEMIGLISRQADGSMRQALVYLSMLNGVTDKKEALALLEKHDEGRMAVELARLLVTGQGATWPNVSRLLVGMQDEAPESIRLTVISYCNRVLLSEKPVDAPRAVRCLSILESFSRPCPQSEGMAPILLACGELLFQ